MRTMGQLADGPRGDIAQVEDRTIPGPAGDIPIRLYDSHPGRQTGPVMVFFHGGGWVIGDLDTHDPYCAEAARQLDMPVVAVDYRLAPAHPLGRKSAVSGKRVYARVDLGGRLSI